MRDYSLMFRGDVKFASFLYIEIVFLLWAASAALIIKRDKYKLTFYGSAATYWGARSPLYNISPMLEAGGLACYTGFKIYSHIDFGLLNK
jgi:hypothetical protein